MKTIDAMKGNKDCEETFIPARFALALLGAFGNRDEADFIGQAERLADYFAKKGLVELQLYALAQIGQVPVFETEESAVRVD